MPGCFVLGWGLSEGAVIDGIRDRGHTGRMSSMSALREHN
eukprot:SAG11_NODE_1350_length_5137_cov_2.743152_6_plen_40_part_00